MATATKKSTSSAIKNVTENFRSPYNIINGTSGNDVITGSSGNDRINGLGGNDQIYAAQGNDIINGGAGTNLLIFKQGNGNDIVENGGGKDTVNFAYQYDLQLERDLSNSDLVIKYGQSDSVTLQNYFSSVPHSAKKLINGHDAATLSYNMGPSSMNALNKYGVKITGTSAAETITGYDGNDKILAGDGDDTVIGGQGDDTLNGGSGNNTFMFSSGDGNDLLQRSTGTDTIQFQANGNIRFERSTGHQDLIIHYGNGDSVTVDKYYNNINLPSLQTIKVGNQSYNVGQAINLLGIDVYGTSNSEAITGSNGNDRIYGQAGNDHLHGGYGNDSLYGGAGSDILYGGYGNDYLDGGDESDTYIFNTYDGHDTIAKGLGKDIVQFNTVQNYSFTWDVSNNNRDLVIKYGSNDTVALENYFSGGYHAVRAIRNGAGAQVQLLENALAQRGLNIIGSSSDDIIKTTFDKHNTIRDYGGNDELRIGCSANLGSELRVLFDVDSTYSLSDGINFGDVNIMAADQVANWIAGNNFYGATIENNAVENIRFGNQSLTSSDIAQIASDVAGWLNTNGFASVQAVLDSNDTTSINALIAEFQNCTNWQ